MDASSLIDKVEKYLRDFILYLMSFFDRSASGRAANDLNQTVIFGIISASLGTYLWGRYIYHSVGTLTDGAGMVVDKIFEWSVAGILIFALLRLVRIECKILDTVLAAIRTMAVAQIIAVIVVYLVLTIVGPFYDISDNNAAYCSYLVYLFLVICYLPAEIGKLDLQPQTEAGRGLFRVRFIAANAVALVLVVLLFIASHSGYSYCNATGELPEELLHKPEAGKQKDWEDLRKNLELRRATNWCKRYMLLHPSPPPEPAKPDIKK